MTDRDLILAAIGDRPSQRAVVAPGYAGEPWDDLWAEFEKNLGALGGRMIDEDEYASLVMAKVWADPALGLPPPTVDLWDAEAGISRAVAAIARTGSLIVLSGPDTYRLSSLVPPINVVVVDRAAIVPTLAEGLAMVSDRTSAIITGPSRTADIEGVMVRGVHGPGELLVHLSR